MKNVDAAKGEIAFDDEDGTETTLPVTGADGLPNHSQHGRLQGVGQVCYPSVATVGGHDVLSQVVGADTEEIHFMGQLVGAGGGGRHLDHDTNFHLGVEGQVAGL